ncbi:MAG: glycosyltransferase family 39 protein, partial [Burkholderiales bacterium]|nr:glycosyltransferase family 39 protein [Burkholderiales bacterium]
MSNLIKYKSPFALNLLLKILIAITVLANALGMLFPVLSSTFSPYYGSIAKHIVLTGNWSDLILSGHDWMDKPHLPFWLTAISFKLFGINSVAYILPGFLFNLLGVYYTYRLARLWYSKTVGLLAALFTITALHLMLSSIDVRAEAYLIGEIMPACYYWLKYDRLFKFKYLLLGALFTALALMTKGIFILITIISGLAVLWIIKGQWRNFISFKWLGALGLSVVFIAPELIALYNQFDLHPEKVIFGHTHMSGIYWYFWNSQFGRFFNTGPIMSSNPPPFHQLYFVHTFLWAYLPWWPMFVAAIYSTIKNKTINHAKVYFYASFFITFILFSVTKFQVDHYTNIIFPFASIICAAWLEPLIPSGRVPSIFYVENIIAALLIVVLGILSLIVLQGVALILIVIVILISLVVVVFTLHSHWSKRILIYPTLTMIVVFIFAMLINGMNYVKYDAGYQM